MTARRAADAGFTLIETLVALGVLAITAIALLGVTEGHVTRVAALESRAAAQWAAENRLAELALGLTPDPGPVQMLGYRITLDTALAETADPDLRRVTLVAREAATGGALARVTGFLLAPDSGWPR